MSQVAIAVMWFLWIALWVAMSFRVKETARQETWRSRAVYVGLLDVAVVLLVVPHIPVLDHAILPRGEPTGWAGAVFVALGLSFSAWARLRLGSNWSGAVTKKENHELITTGPYAFVRHPIYTGLLLAITGSAVSCAELRGVVAVTFATAAFWRKLQLEEAWMREQFGDAYRAYAGRVAALVPFVF